MVLRHGVACDGHLGDHSDGTDISALARSNSEEFAVAGDDSFHVNHYTWPALKAREDGEAVSGPLQPRPWH